MSFDELDLKNRLHATSDPDFEVDPMDIITTGRRTIARRRLLTGAGALGVLAVGGGTWGLLRPPGDPAPADPGRQATPVDSPPPTAAVLNRFVRVDVPDLDSSVKLPDRVTFWLTAGRGGSLVAWQVAFEHGSSSSERPVMGGSLPGPDGVAWNVSGDHPTMSVGVVAGRLRSVLFAATSYDQAQAYDEDLGYSFFVVASQRDIDRRAQLWVAMEDGTVRSATSRVAEQCVVTIDDASFTVAVDATDLLALDQSDASASMTPLSSLKPEQSLILRGVENATRYRLAVLPEAASRIAPDARNRTPKGQSAPSVVIDGITIAARSHRLVAWSSADLEGGLDWYDEAGKLRHTH